MYIQRFYSTMTTQNTYASTLKTIFCLLCLVSAVALISLSIDLGNDVEHQLKESVRDMLTLIRGNKSTQLSPVSDFEEKAELRRHLQNASEEKIILTWHKPTWFNGRNKVNREACGNCVMTLDKHLVVFNPLLLEAIYTYVTKRLAWDVSLVSRLQRIFALYQSETLLMLCPGSFAASKRDLSLRNELLQINDSRTGAVIFHYAFIRNKNMPDQLTRNPNQLHILWQAEPPTHFKGSELINSKYRFNATFSYRRGSDFYENANLILVQRTKMINRSKSSIMQLKTRLGLSMISNCGSNPAAAARVKIVTRLQSLGLAIDAIGDCFKNKSFKKGGNTVNYIQKYKFYMAFENSYHCRDYITEKTYRHGFRSLSVPVVWGATKEDYAAFLPAGSYIFAEDFETLESLADFLKYLDRNDTAYLSYFEWYNKKLPLQGVAGAGKICQVCRALHGINYDDRHRPDYDPVKPNIPTFTNGIAKRAAPLLKTYIFEEENKECLESDPKNWKFYLNWKL